MKIILFAFFCLFLLSCDRMEENPIGKNISIHFPDGPESFVKGTLCNIVWEPASDSRVRIDLYQGNEYSANIVEETINAGTYEWTIPESLQDGSDYRIRITDTKNPEIYGFAGKSFQLLSPGHIDTYTDLRDGCIYNTVRIGDQVWMAENFKYFPGDGSYCYDNNEAYIEVHGRLYTLDAAIEYAPEGWHLPSDEEWKELEAFLGMPSEELDVFGSRGHSPGELLRPVRGIGFNSVFSGYYNHCADGFGHIAYESHYWSSSADSEQKPIIRMVGRYGEIHRMATNCHGGCSVRYIKD